MKKLLLLIALLGAIFLYLQSAEAHPGRTDSFSGHTCYTNCLSYGLHYGEYHYHNSYTPSYPRYNYVPYTPPEPWSCKIGDKTYYSSSEAKDKWREIIHQNVDYYYNQILERKANDNDYSYWESKFPYNNCSWKVDQDLIKSELNSSEEKKRLEEKKIANRWNMEHRKGIIQLYLDLLDREPTKDEVENYAKEGDIKKIEAAMISSDEYKERQKESKKNLIYNIIGISVVGLIITGTIFSRKTLKI